MYKVLSSLFQFQLGDPLTKLVEMVAKNLQEPSVLQTECGQIEDSFLKQLLLPAEQLESEETAAAEEEKKPKKKKRRCAIGQPVVALLGD